MSDQTGEAPKDQSRMSKLRKWLHDFRTDILFDIIKAIIFIIVGYLVAILLPLIPPGNLKSVLSPAPKPVPTENIIYKDCYHLGDDENEGWCHPRPQPNPFVSSFKIDGIVNSASIRVTVKEIGTDEERSPIPVYVNGRFVINLNRKFSVETGDDRTIDIDIPPDYLHNGENNILIFTTTSVGSDGWKNADDFEFHDLMIRLNYP